MNTLFWLTRKAAEILGPDFDLEVVEMHHRLKKDAPSGTATTLLEILGDVRKLQLEEALRHGRKGIIGERTSSEIGIHAIRGGDVVGDHTVMFAANGERVELTHKASSRDTFANGALRAAQWVVKQKPGHLRHAGCAGVEVNAARQSIVSTENGLIRFNTDGFVAVPDVLTSAECAELASELSIVLNAQRQSSKNRIGGVRNLLKNSLAARRIAGCEKILSLVQRVAGSKIFPVRALFFDKTPEANWLVPWHQDLSIAVTERKDVPGFGGWSLKDDVLHVQPTPEILESMVTLRLHLDDCRKENGALKVIPESHLQGKLTTAEVTEHAARVPVVCEVGRGGVLLMRPLLLHASSPAKDPSHRRVLHIEYATGELPGGLKWFAAQT